MVTDKFISWKIVYDFSMMRAARTIKIACDNKAKIVPCLKSDNSIRRTVVLLVQTVYFLSFLTAFPTGGILVSQVSHVLSPLSLQNALS